MIFLYCSVISFITGFLTIWKGWQVYKREMYPLNKSFQTTYTGHLAKRYGVFYIVVGGFWVIVGMFCIYVSL